MSSLHAGLYLHPTLEQASEISSIWKGPSKPYPHLHSSKRVCSSPDILSCTEQASHWVNIDSTLRRLRETGGVFADATCLAIACPACMTLDLAQSCNSYVTTIINGHDMIPTLSPGQAHLFSHCMTTLNPCLAPV